MDPKALRERLAGFALYRKTHLTGDGWVVTRKRICRLWREEGLRRPPQCHKRRRIRPDSPDRLCCGRPIPTTSGPSDFHFDETTAQGSSSC
jgi:hypothetical protein